MSPRAATPTPDRPRETTLARAVVAHLEDAQWDVYEEITLRGGGAPRADIVARQGPLLWVVEVKQSLSLAVLEQALHWLPYAHFVSIAVPHARHEVKGRRAAQRFCWHEGIGIFTIRLDQRLPVFVDRAPTLGRQRVIPGFATQLRAALTPHTKTSGAAGNADQAYWTPFRHTCDEIRRVLRDAGTPLTTRALIDQVTHHYSSDLAARANLRRWLAAGKVAGVEAAPPLMVPGRRRPQEQWQLADPGAMGRSDRTG